MGNSHWMEEQKGDFSNGGNDTFDPENDYIGIRLKQGVPLLDRDWNELEDIRRYQELRLRKNYIGDGTCNDGFRISRLDPTSPDYESNFHVSEGSYLVEGLEVKCKCSDYKTIAGSSPTSSISGKYIFLDVWIDEYDGPNNSQDVGKPTCVRHVLKYTIKLVDTYEYPDSKKELKHEYAPLARIRPDGNGVEDLRSRFLPLNYFDLTPKLNGCFVFGKVSDIINKDEDGFLKQPILATECNLLNKIIVVKGEIFLEGSRDIVSDRLLPNNLPSPNYAWKLNGYERWCWFDEPGSIKFGFGATQGALKLNVQKNRATFNIKNNEANTALKPLEYAIRFIWS